MRMRATYVEVLVFDAVSHGVLVGEVFQHAVQNRWTVQFVDEFAQPCHHSQCVGVELAAVHVLDVHAGE